MTYPDISEDNIVAYVTDNEDNLPQAGAGPGKDGVEGTEQLDDNYNDPRDEEMSSKIFPSHIVLTEAIHCQSQGNKKEYGQNYYIISLDVQGFSISYPNIEAKISSDITTILLVILIILHFEKEIFCFLFCCRLVTGLLWCLACVKVSAHRL